MSEKNRLRALTCALFAVTFLFLFAVATLAGGTDPCESAVVQQYADVIPTVDGTCAFVP